LRPGKAASSERLRASKIRARASREAVARRLPSGDQDTHSTSSPWPPISPTQTPLSASQSRTLRSWEQEAMKRPSGETRAASMSSS
jgi:hypothetical protein